jgi:uncharacterized protein with FMN-binding domain
MERKITIPLIGITLVILIGAGIAVKVHRTTSSVAAQTTVYQLGDSSPSAVSTATANDVLSSAIPTSASSVPISTYKDGTYQADGQYLSPGGSETVGVSITLANSVISDVVITPKSQDSQGAFYQQRFAQGIATIVKGKALDSTFDVAHVNGASLTGKGFNGAIQSIRTQAK